MADRKPPRKEVRMFIADVGVRVQRKLDLAARVKKSEEKKK